MKDILLKLYKSEKPLKIEWIALICLFAFLFVNFVYFDISFTATNSVNFIDLLLKGEVYRFYELNPGITYDFLIFIPFSIWNFPLFIISKFTEINIFTQLLPILWVKGMLVVFMLGSSYVLGKIAELFGINNNNKKWIKYLFISSPLLMMALSMFGGYDIISIFFTLLGIYHYIKGNKKSFVLYFSIAICLKLFALFIFIPLVLLKEKNIIKDGLYILGGLFFTVIGKLVYRDAPMYYESISEFNDKMENRLFASVISNPFGNISIFFVLFILICIFAYCLNAKKEEIKNYAIYICFLVYAVFCTFVFIHSQWAILIVPYTVLIIICNSHRVKENILLDIGFSFALLMILYILQPGVFSQKDLMERMLLDEIYNNIPTYGNLNILFYLELDKYLPLLNAVMCACLIAFAYINYPTKWKNDNNIKIPRALIWCRLLLIVPFAAIIIYYYFK